MKTILLVITVLFFKMANAQNSSIYSYDFISLSGDTIELSSFKGKKILFVNVASKCGFTGQYTELQELHDTHGEDLVLIGFPCNQFGGQEPGTEAEIQAFCQKNYGVTFLMASKIDVKGEGQHPIYTWLTSEKQNGKEDSKVSWNFEKYLVDENGALIGHFKSQVKPMSEKIISLL
jgi:glutathione peroxidase